MSDEQKDATEEEPRFPMAEEPPEMERDENDPGDVPTSFTTNGVGWSGRDKS